MVNSFHWQLSSWWPLSKDMNYCSPRSFDLLNVISDTLLFFMLFVLLALILKCTYDQSCNVAWVSSILGFPSTIGRKLSFFNIPFILGYTFIQNFFAYRNDIAISFGHFLYGIFWKSHFVRTLTVCMRLYTWYSCSSAPTISKWTGLNFLHTTPNS